MSPGRTAPVAFALLITATLAACSSTTPNARATARTTGPTASATATTAPATPTPVTPTTSGASSSPTPTRPRPVPIPGLPEQGVAVEHGGAVDLHAFAGGAPIAHLDGFSIDNPTAEPYHLVLEHDGTYYLLEEFERRLRPLASKRAADRLSGHDQHGLHLPLPTSGGRPMAGHWRYETVDPHYGERVMAQWSGECEVPTAFFVDLDEGDATPVTGEADPAGAPESFALGWTIRGQAVVFLPEGACGAGANPPGVYLYRKPGEGRLVVGTPPPSFARMWGTTIAG